MLLELHYGLDHNNEDHIWLLHVLFLDIINHEADLFVATWNHHQISMRGNVSRSPIAIFAMDSLMNGPCGDQYIEPEELGMEDMGEFGVDWEAYDDTEVMESYHANNPTELPCTLYGRVGPPDMTSLTHIEVEVMHNFWPDKIKRNQILNGVATMDGHLDEEGLIWRWCWALLFWIDHK